jgi:hypothetical protein
MRGREDRDKPYGRPQRWSGVEGRALNAASLCIGNPFGMEAAP